MVPSSPLARRAVFSTSASLHLILSGVGVSQSTCCLMAVCGQKMRDSRCAQRSRDPSSKCCQCLYVPLFPKVRLKQTPDSWEPISPGLAFRWRICLPRASSPGQVETCLLRPWPMFRLCRDEEHQSCPAGERVQ